MSLARKVAWNTVIHVVGKLLGNIIGVVVVALLTRYLGQEGFGNYATILAYIFFFSAFADLGLYMITINELNKTGIDRRRFFSAVYSLRFFTGMALMFMAGVSVWLMPYPLIVKQGVVIASFTVFFRSSRSNSNSVLSGQSFHEETGDNRCDRKVDSFDWDFDSD